MSDIFADIAQSYGQGRREGLVRPSPAPMLDKTIRLHQGGVCAFEPMPKIDNEQKLSQRLLETRERYRQYLQDLAPVPSPVEQVIAIESFSFSLNGDVAGQIKIPHYGGPTGEQTAEYSSVFMLDEFSGKCVMLCFKGVDYIAEVYVNGLYAGSHEGFFAPFEFDITAAAKRGENSLKVIVRNLEKMQLGGDKIYAATGLGWDDPYSGWHHCPGGLGIYNHVNVEIRESSHITDLFARVTDEVQELWVECNGADVSDVYFAVSLYGQNFLHTEYEDMIVKPETELNIGLNDTFTEAKMGLENVGKPIPLKLGAGFNRFILPFSISNARRWSPDTPYLYKVIVKMYVDGRLVSQKSRQFGVRTFTQSLTSEPRGKFYLNGKEIRLYGTNTMGFEQQDVFKGDFEQLIDDILLSKICNMNFWRITQRPVQEEVYDYCDRLGLMVQTDLPLFGSVRINQYFECIRQGGEMERLVRSHPCCIINSYINEPFPNGNNQPHRMLRRHEMQSMFECLDHVVLLHNPDRVIKHVDGDYDAPGTLLPDNHCYPMWYNGHGIEMGLLHKGYWMDVAPGWHYGCGEFGSEGLDSLQVMRKYYPKDWLAAPFNPDNIIGSQSGRFHKLFFETPDTIERWISESQRHQAFSTRIMAGAMRCNTDMNTFAIHLFIDAFPSGWMKAIMDCERRPKQAFYEYMDCLSPVFCRLRGDRMTYFAGDEISLECYLCNDTDIQIDSLRVMVTADDGVLYSDELGLCGGGISQGRIVFNAPQVHKREYIYVHLSAFSEDVQLHSATERLEIFAKSDYKIPHMISWEEYNSERRQFEDHVKGGGRLIITGPSTGEHEIMGKKVIVTKCGMDPLYCSSRDTGHSCVQGLEANDLSWLYDGGSDRIAPIIYSTFKADGAIPIVLGANHGSVNGWEWQLACGEWRYGEGRVILNMLDLCSKQMNPAVAMFLDNLEKFKCS